MPELPEVETIVRGLFRAAVGKQIVGTEVRMAKIAVAPPGVRFDRAITGQTIAGVRRRGKYAVIALSGGASLVVGLRMTGRLLVSAADEPEVPGAHVVFRFHDGGRLSFADVRTFGRVRLVEAGDSWDRDLGVEPLSSGFTQEAFIGMLAGRTTPVKALLLDQRRIAGIGNIYACEALWEARIRPSRPARALTKPAIRRLHHAVVDVLSRAIEMRGSSVDDYVDADGLRGGYQNVLSVYGRLGKPCLRCGNPVVRTVLAQRGTWWCRRCQR
ncbi:MAG: bifunctional DNA-formamidopyrimidine glycosylase/DNA-(apurinic or apyrimidinic site) lyase [Candidatus Eremiobacteraeota bacterium]|nr:bifunctional DNA-formamidopyrimidine glycosylase/DNA-(apurinic or apyrimidinic site) lyase [Candidatus Eremiobacteraeota bacterium]